MKIGLVPGGALFMGLVVSLAVLGVGYGLWSDTLRISGAVSTGSVNAAFRLHEVDEGLARGAPNGPSDNGVNEDLEYGGIDTAECRVLLTASAALAADDLSSEALSARGSDRMALFIRNGYPSFNCYVDFGVVNVGRIPIKVQRPALGPLPPASVLTVEFQRCYEPGEQVEPGKEALCTLHVHVERGAAQNTTYRFGATICAYQWNAEGPVICPVLTDIEPLPLEVEPAPRALPNQ
jgi:hypothetical protein